MYQSDAGDGISWYRITGEGVNPLSNGRLAVDWITAYIRRMESITLSSGHRANC